MDNLNFNPTYVPTQQTGVNQAYIDRLLNIARQRGLVNDGTLSPYADNNQMAQAVNQYAQYSGQDPTQVYGNYSNVLQNLQKNGTYAIPSQQQIAPEDVSDMSQEILHANQISGNGNGMSLDQIADALQKNPQMMKQAQALILMRNKGYASANNGAQPQIPWVQQQ